MTPYCKLVWLKHEKPDIFNQATRFISLKEYILYKLFGNFVIDEAMASATGLFNLNTGGWSEAAMHVAGIETSKLSQIVPIFYKQTELVPSIKQQFGLHGNIEFIAGSGDGGAAQLGSGALLENEACFTIGTSGAVRTFIHSPVTDDQQRIFTYLFTKGWYFTGGATNNGGVIMEWFAQLFLPDIKKEESFDKIINLAKSSDTGAKGLLFVPYLNGERAPVWDASATGQFAGIKSIHTLGDFARAVIEGVLLNMFDIFQSLPNRDKVDTIYANGGFFNNPFMAQLLADITGRKVLLQKDSDSSAIGAVYEGMLAVGWLKDMAEVKQFVTTDDTFTPDEKQHGVYKDVFGRYVGLRK
jgi:gluconokinase